MKKLFLIWFATGFWMACKKETYTDPASVQTALVVESQRGGSDTLSISTLPVDVGSAILVTVQGNISNSNAGNSVTERGFCLSLQPEPSTADDTTHAGSGSGAFSAILGRLTPGTTYYVRAYAIRGRFIYYGNEQRFTTLTLGIPTRGAGSDTDIDGNVYTTITLGTQVWMTENLKTTRYRDGSPVLHLPFKTEWMTALNGGYCNYDNDPVNGEQFGRIYNLYALTDPRNLAPAGWRIPDDNDWMTLLRYLGGIQVAGGRMKEARFEHWLQPNTEADNSSGFTGRGAGWRNYNNTSGEFGGLLTEALFWSSGSRVDKRNNRTNLHAVALDYNTADYRLVRDSARPEGARTGFYIRCIKE